MKDKNEKVSTGGEDKGALSRREWLIDVGKAAALAGIAGKAVPLEGEGAAGLVSGGDKPERLPPGLYRPSPGHLASSLESDSRFHPIPPGCPVDFIRPRSGPFEPQFFSPSEYGLVHRLTALMLGEPDGGGESGRSSNDNIVDEVAEWIDLRTHSFAGIREAAERLTPEQAALAEAYDGAPLLHRVRATDPQKTYQAGLEWMAEESERRHGRGFMDLTGEQQAAILDLISDDHSDPETESDGTRFFRQLKSDVISGFYTSRTGLKELDYKGNQFYAESPGCASSSPGRAKPHR